ncbi:MAG: GNAT family N-acetyltransferase [Thermodesulfobacteriota bacterium]
MPDRLTLEAISWREEVRAGDVNAIRRLCRSSGFFSQEEIEVAGELAEERLAKGLVSGYHFIFAEEGEVVSGYSCFGPIPFTQGSWDLYWVVVDDSRRGRGLGGWLLEKTEKMAVARGCRRLYVETSSREQYHPTRVFYQRRNYTTQAVLKDFYAPGEHKIIYLKVLAA